MSSDAPLTTTMAEIQLANFTIKYKRKKNVFIQQQQQEQHQRMKKRNNPFDLSEYIYLSLTHY